MSGRACVFSIIASRFVASDSMAISLACIPACLMGMEVIRIERQQSEDTYLNMRLSVAGAAKDAQVKNCTFLSDFTRNLDEASRKTRPGPNIASCVLPGRPHRLAVGFRELPEGIS